jgi:hypothetical protein
MNEQLLNEQQPDVKITTVNSNFSEIIEPLTANALPKFADCQKSTSLLDGYEKVIRLVSSVLNQMEKAENHRDFQTAFDSYRKITNVLRPKKSVIAGYGLLKEIDRKNTCFLTDDFSVIPDEDKRAGIIDKYFATHTIENTNENSSAIETLYATIAKIEARITSFQSSFEAQGAIEKGLKINLR